MVSAVGTPKRRAESGIYWFRKRVPDRLAATVGKREIKFSLRTRDPATARLRNLEAMLEIERAWAGCDISGLDAVTGAAVKIQCKSSGPALGQLSGSQPPQDGAVAQAAARASAMTLRAVFDAYANEAELSPATLKRWSPVIDRLAEHLGHDDPGRIVRPDIVAWKDALLKKGIGPRTVRDVYLASVKAMFQYAVDQGNLTENPAQRVKVRVKKALHEREKGFNHDEALIILAATLRPFSDKTSVETAAARRWVPWLCAYSGARVNELTCLTGRDIVERNGIPMIRIKAETAKTRKWRNVPLHPHLIEQGFMDYARSRSSKPLFFEPSRSRGGKDGNPHHKKTAERLGEWVRSLGIDPRVAPNHGWRHRFSSITRYTGMPEDVRNVIQGHADAKIADHYGDTWPEVAAREIAKIPRYEP